MDLKKVTENTLQVLPAVGEMAARNLKVTLDLLPSALHGFILQEGKSSDHMRVANKCPVDYNWKYDDFGNGNEFDKIYKSGKQGQWDSDDMKWNTDVDPFNLEMAIFPESLIPGYGQSFYPKDKKSRGKIVHSTFSWVLSQFLHGEQGALHVSCQTVEVTPWVSAKMYGSTQVMDEARHVEVFYRYLNEKLEKLYQIDDNLYTILHYLSGAGDWDIKYLGMQIMVEGLALGAFSTFYRFTKEPLLKEILKGTIADEARHVHYGVVALRDYYKTEISPAKLREREDWAYEIAKLLRDRFLFLEIHQEFFAHALTTEQWIDLVMDSQVMSEFRKSLFQRLMPNLREIGLLSPRMESKYDELGLLKYASAKSADRLTLKDLLEDIA